MSKNTWLVLLLLMPSVPLALRAQPLESASFLPDAPSVARLAGDAAGGGPLTPPEPLTPAIIRTEVPEPPRFAWRAASNQSMTMLMFQHGARMAQHKTREHMGGPFFQDYAESITNIGGWEDGDGLLTNYVAHPMMGAISGYVEVQNDRDGVRQEFSASREYWNSRLRAMAFAAAYSAQFEIGPFSEAAFGNVGMKKGTAGLVDFVMTPSGGLGWILVEDALDRYAIQAWEAGASPPRKRFYRTLFNPCRSIANLLRRKVPWHRDNRPMFSTAGREEVSVTAGGN